MCMEISKLLCTVVHTHGLLGLASSSVLLKSSIDLGNLDMLANPSSPCPLTLMCCRL